MHPLNCHKCAGNLLLLDSVRCPTRRTTIKPESGTDQSCQQPKSGDLRKELPRCPQSTISKAARLTYDERRIELQ